MRKELFFSVAMLLARARLATAQTAKDKFVIKAVKVGYPAGAHQAETEDSIAPGFSIYKQGCWCPVYVDLLCVGEYKDNAELVVTTQDSDEMNTIYSIPIPQMQPGTSQMLMAYTRPGGSQPKIKISVRDSKHRLMCDEVEQNYLGHDPGNVFYLTIGSRLAGMILPGTPDGAGRPATPGMPFNQNMGGRSQSVAMTSVQEMPTQW